MSMSLSLLWRRITLTLWKAGAPKAVAAKELQAPTKHHTWFVFVSALPATPLLRVYPKDKEFRPMLLQGQQSGWISTAVIGYKIKIADNLGQLME